MTVSIEFLGLSWTCPGCSHSNHDDDMYSFEHPTQCAACKKFWQECPNDDCYGLGPDCATCGGQSGGLVEIAQP
jgi:hypothetical protein